MASSSSLSSYEELLRSTSLRRPPTFFNASAWKAHGWRLVKPPVVDWLLKYHWKTFLADFVAALIVASLLVPQALAYSVLGGLPAIYGLRANVVGPILYSVFGTVRHGIVGAVALSMIVTRVAVTACDPAAATAADQTRFEDLTFGVALLSGVIQLVVGLLRGGVVSDLFSRPMMSAFLTAAGAIIVISQVRPLFGLPHVAEDGSSLVQLFKALADLGSISWPTFGLSAATLLLLVASRRLPKWLPSSLIIMALSILISWAASLEAHGIRVVGEIDSGLPSARAPTLSPADVGALLPGALEVAAVGFVGQFALGMQFGTKFRYAVDGNMELVASGLSNIAASLFQGPPITMSFSRTAANADVGGQTPIVNVLVSLMACLTLLVLTPLFRPLPVAVLACVIVLSCRQLIDLGFCAFLWRVSKLELFLVYFPTFFATIGLGIEVGIVVGVACSLLAVVFRNSQQLPEIDATSNVDGVVVVVFRGPLSFVNASSLAAFLVKTTAKMMTAGSTAPLAEHSSSESGGVALIDLGDDAPRASAHQHALCDRALLLDLGGVSSVDATALQTLQIVLPQCFNLTDARADQRKPVLALAALNLTTYDKMQRAGLVKLIGAQRFHVTRRDALAALADEVARSPLEVGDEDSAAPASFLAPPVAASSAAQSPLLGRLRTLFSRSHLR
jgi:SulP family sulfate permease